MTELPNRIRVLRKNKGLSLEELAELVGTSYGQISHLEKETRGLTVTWMRRIALALECRPADLLQEDDKMSIEDIGDNVGCIYLRGIVDIYKYSKSDTILANPKQTGRHAMGAVESASASTQAIEYPADRPARLDLSKEYSALMCAGFEARFGEAFPGLLPTFLNDYCLVKISNNLPYAPDKMLFGKVTQGSNDELFNVTDLFDDSAIHKDVRIMESRYFTGFLRKPTDDRMP